MLKMDNGIIPDVPNMSLTQRYSLEYFIQLHKGQLTLKVTCK